MPGSFNGQIVGRSRSNFGVIVGKELGINWSNRAWTNGWPRYESSPSAGKVLRAKAAATRNN